MEIELGEYIRDNKGNIGKVIGIFDGHCAAKYHIEFKGNVKVKRQYLSTKTIVKHSKNIIDLIEVGDVLNIDNEKYEVIYDKSYEKLGILIPDRKQLAVKHSSVEFIFQKYKNIEILTKEQYNSNCYRVEE